MAPMFSLRKHESTEAHAEAHASSKKQFASINECGKKIKKACRDTFHSLARRCSAGDRGTNANRDYTPCRPVSNPYRRRPGYPSTGQRVSRLPAKVVHIPKRSGRTFTAPVEPESEAPVVWEEPLAEDIIVSLGDVRRQVSATRCPTVIQSWRAQYFLEAAEQQSDETEDVDSTDVRCASQELSHWRAISLAEFVSNAVWQVRVEPPKVYPALYTSIFPSCTFPIYVQDGVYNEALSTIIDEPTEPIFGPVEPSSPTSTNHIRSPSNISTLSADATLHTSSAPSSVDSLLLENKGINGDAVSGLSEKAIRDSQPPKGFMVAPTEYEERRSELRMAAFHSQLYSRLTALDEFPPNFLKGIIGLDSKEFQKTDHNACQPGSCFCSLSCFPCRKFINLDVLAKQHKKQMIHVLVDVAGRSGLVAHPPYGELEIHGQNSTVEIIEPESSLTEEETCLFPYTIDLSPYLVATNVKLHSSQPIVDLKLDCRIQDVVRSDSEPADMITSLAYLDVRSLQQKAAIRRATAAKHFRKTGLLGQVVQMRIAPTYRVDFGDRGITYAPICKEIEDEEEDSDSDASLVCSLTSGEESEQCEPEQRHLAVQRLDNEHSIELYEIAPRWLGEIQPWTAALWRGLDYHQEFTPKAIDDFNLPRRSEAQATWARALEIAAEDSLTDAVDVYCKLAHIQPSLWSVPRDDPYSIPADFEDKNDGVGADGSSIGYESEHSDSDDLDPEYGYDEDSCVSVEGKQTCDTCVRQQGRLGLVTPILSWIEEVEKNREAGEWLVEDGEYSLDVPDSTYGTGYAWVVDTHRLQQTLMDNLSRGQGGIVRYNKTWLSTSPANNTQKTQECELVLPFEMKGKVVFAHAMSSASTLKLQYCLVEGKLILSADKIGQFEVVELDSDAYRKAVDNKFWRHELRNSGASCELLSNLPIAELELIDPTTPEAMPVDKQLTSIRFPV